MVCEPEVRPIISDGVFGQHKDADHFRVRLLSAASVYETELPRAQRSRSSATANSKADAAEAAGLLLSFIDLIVVAMARTASSDMTNVPPTTSLWGIIGPPPDAGRFWT